MYYIRHILYILYIIYYSIASRIPPGLNRTVAKVELHKSPRRGGMPAGWNAPSGGSLGTSRGAGGGLRGALKCILGASWALCRPRSPQESRNKFRRHRQDAPKRPQMAARRPPRGPNIPPRGPQNSPQRIRKRHSREEVENLKIDDPLE